jgi:hypothetical protein
MTADTLDLGACPSCHAPRRLDWRADEPGRLDALTDHMPDCQKLPILTDQHEHTWQRLPDATGHVPWGWLVETCTACRAVHVARDHDTLRAAAERTLR